MFQREEQKPLGDRDGNLESSLRSEPYLWMSFWNVPKIQLATPLTAKDMERVVDWADDRKLDHLQNSTENL
jgi:hypothetical protein